MHDYLHIHEILQQHTGHNVLNCYILHAQLEILNFVIYSMSSLRGMIEGAGKHIQETTVENIKKLPEEVIDSGRKLFRIAQTLEDYNITAKITKKELRDALEGFHNNHLQNIENGISQRLLLAMDTQNLPINVEKVENLYNEIQAIEGDPNLTPTEKKEKRLALLDVIDLRGLNKELQEINDPKSNLSAEEKKKRRKEIREELATKKDKLTTQDILSLEIYNYIISFWITHIKDGNNIEHLILEDLQKPRPPKPNNEPKKPQESTFQNKQDYEQAILNYENEMIQRKKEYKARNEWNGKTQWMTAITKTIADLGPINRLPTGFIQHLSAIFERSLGVGFQHGVERKWRPNILEMSKQEEDLIENILLDVQRGKKFFIFLNHETFANIPITIVKFMQVAHKKEIDIENVNKYFTTIIGPLLATHRWQKFALNLISNILVTHPADNRIPGAKRIATLHQQIAKDQLEKDLTEESSGGQIYFCAPTGTRDIIHYLDNGEEQIFMPDETRGSTVVTCNMVKALHAKNPDLRVFTMSTNTTDLKRPDLEKLEKIQNNSKLSHKRKEKKLKELRTPNNNEWRKNGTVTMHIEEIKLKDFSKEDMFFGIQKTLKNDTLKKKLKEDPDYNKIKEVIRATQKDSEIALKSIFELINKITKTTNNLELLEIIYPLRENLETIQQTSELIGFEQILEQINNAIEIVKNDPSNSNTNKDIERIKKDIERMQQNSDIILECSLNLSDRTIEIVKNDPELLNIVSKYIIDKNLSPKHINKTLVKNTTHAIPSNKPHKPSKNPIKRHRDRGKQYYDRDINGKIKEVQCAQTLPPQPFKDLKKETKTKQYAYTGHLPTKYQKDGKIDPEIVKSETEKASQNSK